MNKIELAVSRFNDGFSCSQAIFSTYAEQFDIDYETALKVSSAFGGGIAGMGGMCGVVSGAFMLIGLKYGKIKAEDKQAKEKTYKLVREFVSKFETRNNSIICKKLLGYDMNNPEERKIISEKGLTTTLCPKFIRDAIEILEQIL